MTHTDHAHPISLPAGDARVVGRAPFIERASWAIYEFAHTLFSMNVLSLYFAVWLVNDLALPDLAYSTANAISSVLIVLAIPVLGAMSDVRRRRRPWVIGFTVTAAVATALMGVFGQRLLPLVGSGVDVPAGVPPGWYAGGTGLLVVLAVFIVANFGYQAAQPFFNAMLTELAPPNERGRLSGYAAGVGYMGSIVGVLLVFPFFRGEIPGLGALSAGTMHALHSLVPFTAHGGRVSTFVPTALLFLLFSLPLFVFCRDHNPAPAGTAVAWREAFREVAHTLRDARQHPGALRFILTSFVYQDAIGTIVGFMALYAVKAVGFEKGAEATLLLVLTIPAIFGSFIYGFLIDRIGARRSLMLTLSIWIVLLIAVAAVPGKSAFWAIGFAIGLNYGGVAAAERPVLLTLVPSAEAGRYFSLMLLSARTAAILGPLIWAVTVDGLTASMGVGVAYRAAVLTVAIMFVIAVVLLRKVPDRPPAQA